MTDWKYVIKKFELTDEENRSLEIQFSSTCRWN